MKSLRVVLGTFPFLVWAVWCVWRNPVPPYRYDHWSYRLMCWIDGVPSR